MLLTSSQNYFIIILANMDIVVVNMTIAIILNYTGIRVTVIIIIIFLIGIKYLGLQLNYP